MDSLRIINGSNVVFHQQIETICPTLAAPVGSLYYIFHTNISTTATPRPTVAEASPASFQLEDIAKPLTQSSTTTYVQNSPSGHCITKDFFRYTSLNKNFYICNKLNGGNSPPVLATRFCQIHQSDGQGLAPALDASLFTADFINLERSVGVYPREIAETDSILSTPARDAGRPDADAGAVNRRTTPPRQRNGRN